MRWSIAPSLLVEDLVSTANYYRDALGFRYGRFWGGPPGVCMVQRQGIVIMLRRAAPSGPTRGSTPTPGTPTCGSTMRIG